MRLLVNRMFSNIRKNPTVIFFFGQKNERNFYIAKIPLNSSAKILWQLILTLQTGQTHISLHKLTVIEQMFGDIFRREREKKL